VPLAAASLAQVHRAALRDGTEVAVKVQYPEVAALVRLDLRNLRTMARLVAWREPGFDYRAIVDELGRQIPLEVDFVREAEMSRRIAENLREIPGIVVPDVIDGMVSRRVLVTHFYDGERVVGNRSAGLEAAERESLATQDRRCLRTPDHGRRAVPGRPAPGQPAAHAEWGRDPAGFWANEELPDDIRIGFARLVIAAAARDPHAVMQAFKGLGIRTGTDDPQDLVALTNLFFDARPIDGGQRQFQEQRSRAMARSPVEAIPGDLVLLGRVVGLLRGVCASLGVALSPMQMLQPYAVRALEEAEGMKEGAGTAP
jgi:predicted unusual protein kinase regulating ubiquinone biosynthesis (AarF/ABC1/UbiB family)